MKTEINLLILCICVYIQTCYCFVHSHIIYRYAESVGAKHYYTSAKQNKGIGELFLDLAKSLFITVCFVAMETEFDSKVSGLI